jgi:hypothetical protein
MVGFRVSIQFQTLSQQRALYWVLRCFSVSSSVELGHSFYGLYSTPEFKVTVHFALGADVLSVCSAAGAPR